MTKRALNRAKMLSYGARLSGGKMTQTVIAVCVVGDQDRLWFLFVFSDSFGNFLIRIYVVGFFSPGSRLVSASERGWVSVRERERKRARAKRNRAR